MDPGPAANSVLAKMGLGPDRSRKTRTYHRDDACRAVYRDADQLAQQAGNLSVEPLHLLWSLAHGADPTLTALLTPRGLTAEALSQICAQLSQRHFTPPGAGHAPCPSRHRRRSQRRPQPSP